MQNCKGLILKCSNSMCGLIWPKKDYEKLPESDSKALTWAMHPDAMGFFSNLTKISLHLLPKALDSFLLVMNHECLLVWTCSLMKRLHRSLENKSLLLLAHWPNLIKVGPDLSTTNNNNFNHRRLKVSFKLANGYRQKMGPKVNVIRRKRRNESTES